VDSWTASILSSSCPFPPRSSISFHFSSIFFHFFLCRLSIDQISKKIGDTERCVKRWKARWISNSGYSLELYFPPDSTCSFSNPSSRSSFPPTLTGAAAINNVSNYLIEPRSTLRVWPTCQDKVDPRRLIGVVSPPMYRSPLHTDVPGLHIDANSVIEMATS
jgi:hypothetical protein